MTAVALRVWVRGCVGADPALTLEMGRMLGVGVQRRWEPAGGRLGWMRQACASLRRTTHYRGQGYLACTRWPRRYLH